MKHQRILRRSFVITLCLCAGYIFQGGQACPQLRKTDAGRIPAGKPAVSFAKLPLSFESNEGQTDARVEFLSRGPGYTVFLTGEEVVLALRRSEARRLKLENRNWKAEAAADIPRPLILGPRSPFRGSEPGRPTLESLPPTVLRLKLLGANPAAKVSGVEELPGKANYFIGNDAKKWRTNVPTYARVKYEGVYPGVDVIYYGNQRQLEHDFVVAPRTNPSGIALRLEGSKKISLDAEGNLDIAVEGGEVHLQKPLVYQQSSGGRRQVAGGYVLKGASEVVFEVGAYDRAQSLVIDPVLAYSTYLGGSYDNGASAIAVDSSGNTYVTGGTDSSDFPTTAGAFQTSLAGGIDAFVTKLNPTGTALVYSTYLGGNYMDSGQGIAVDSSGDAYVTGLNESSNFPTTPGAFQTSYGGVQGGYVTELNPSGSALVYSTYLGGSSYAGYGAGQAIALDSSGNAYVTGWTGATNFPATAGAFQTSLGAAYAVNAFVTKLNPTGTASVYSTYLGGNFVDSGQGIAVDSSGDAYVTGTTGSSNFPTTAGTYQGTFGGGSWDAFVTKLKPDGSALVYSTYLGGAGEDQGSAIALDSSGNSYVTGGTSSTNFPTTEGAFQTALAGSENAFVTKLNPTGTALAYSTYLGGSSGDFADGIAVDSSGNAYLTGAAMSSNFPTTADAFQTSLVGITNAFVTTLNPQGSALVYSTYLGGSNNDTARGIGLDSLGNTYVSGTAGSSNFPTTEGAFQTSLQGISNAFVAEFENTSQAQVTNLQNTVKNLVSAGTLSPAVGQFLLAPLNAALAALGPDPATAAVAASSRSDTAAAIEDLSVFIIEVRLLVVLRALKPAEGQTLINAANTLIAELRSSARRE